MNTSKVVIKGGQTRQARRLMHVLLSRLRRAAAGDQIDDDDRIPVEALRRLRTEARRRTAL
jgi:hypothetical protein